jgi:hypothetical protein
MKLLKFKPGDIILVFDDSEVEHSLIWVDGVKPIVDSGEGNKYSGVSRRSLKAFKGIDEEPPKVWRSNDSKLAENAAKFAIKWATSSDEKWIWEEYEKTNKKVQLRTPYSQDKLVKATEAEKNEWNEEVFLSTLQKTWRGVNDKNLSSTGVSCAMFIVYCYQAAILEPFIGELKEYWSDLKNKKDAIKLLNKQPELRKKLIIKTLEPVLKVQDKIPQAFKVNAKLTDVDKLLDSLKQDKTFKQVGKVITDNNDSPNQAKIIDKESPELGKIKLKTLIDICRKHKELWENKEVTSLDEKEFNLSNDDSDEDVIDEE